MRTLKSNGGVVVSYQNPSSKRIVGGRTDRTLAEQRSVAEGHILAVLRAATSGMTSRDIEESPLRFDASQAGDSEAVKDLYSHLDRLTREDVLSFAWGARNGKRCKLYSLKDAP